MLTSTEIEAWAPHLEVLDQETGVLAPLLLTVEQVEVYAALREHARVVILKARQQGISTICCLNDVLYALSHPGQAVAIVADTQDKAQGLLAKCRGWLRSMGVRLDVDNATRIVLESGASIDALSAVAHAEGGESRTGRSRSYGLIHCSELAFWYADRATMAALLSTALPGARVVVESTASSAANLFNQLWHGVDEEGKPVEDDWYRIFLSVERHEAYRADPASISDARWVELQALGFENRAAAAWWDGKYRTDLRGDLHRTLREYPARAYQAFSFAEGRWIHTFERIEPVRMDGYWRIYCENPQEPVVAGVDTGEGVGGDYSSIYLIGLWTGQTIATWSCNTLDVAAFAGVILECARRWKPKAIVIEKNGIGAGTLSLVRNGCSVAVAHKSSDGEKPVRFAAFRQALAQGWLKAGPCLETEIKSSVVDRDGSYTGRDDLINAGSFAVIYREKNPDRPPVPEPDRRQKYVPRPARSRRSGGLV